MSCLVYCITREDAHVHGLACKASAPARLPVAENTVCQTTTNCEGPVCVVTQAGLAAAISHVPDSDVAPTVPRLRAFAAVVEALHDVCTVLPMRYGCVLPTEERVLALLKERGPEFMDALNGVEGCVEMSIRAIFDTVCQTTTNCEDHVAPPTRARKASARAHARFEPPDVSTGKAYLAARQAYYARQALSAQAAKAIAERAAALLRGLFVRHASEYSPFPVAPYNVPTLSLHYLVRRDRVEPFRARAETLRAQECLGHSVSVSPPAGAPKMLLSGPWPPYNFTVCQTTTNCVEPEKDPLL